MALWLCRAGQFGEYETKFIEDNSIYCTWDDLDWNLSDVADWEAFRSKIRQTYPGVSSKKASHHAGQIWAFAHKMKPGDLVVLPSKIKPTVYVGKITSDYKYATENEQPYRHVRQVEWIKELPRKSFDQDLLFSFGAFMTICQIARNDAEQRVSNYIKISINTPNAPINTTPDEVSIIEEEIDIEENALQEISDRLIAKYKGHGMSKIIAAILEAKGYKTFVSPPGPARQKHEKIPKS